MRNYSEDTPHRADRTIDTHGGPITGTRIRLSAREQRCTHVCLGINGLFAFEGVGVLGGVRRVVAG